MTEDERERILAWADVLDDSNYYEVLGVLEIADPLAIKEAFHRFALAFHPDQHVDAPPDLRDAVRQVFKRGAEAYRVLSDAGLRNKYDLAVARGQLRLDAGDVPPQGSVGNVQSLEDLASSPGAKMYARRAEDYLTAGDLRAAKRELMNAIQNEKDGNPELEERVEAIELAIFAMGE